MDDTSHTYFIILIHEKGTFDMSAFTQKAIREAFLKLLHEKPLSKITIRSIAETCGINRNTFYYYYQDLPQLVEAIISEDAEQIIQAHPSVESIEACLDAAIGFAQAHRQAVLHIYRSVNLDIYEHYQWRICDHVVSSYIDRLLTGRNVSEPDRQLITDYASCLCFGMILGWLEHGMQDDVRARFHRLCALKQGEVERMIAKCEESK